MEILETNFANIIKSRISENPQNKIKISKDDAFNENPMDRQNIEEDMDAEEVKSLMEVFEETKKNEFPDVDYLRVPVVEESAPQGFCFDLIVNALRNEEAATECIFSCQAGRGRTTLGRNLRLVAKLSSSWQVQLYYHCQTTHPPSQE